MPVPDIVAPIVPVDGWYIVNVIKSAATNVRPVAGDPIAVYVPVIHLYSWNVPATESNNAA